VGSAAVAAAASAAVSDVTGVVLEAGTTAASVAAIAVGSAVVIVADSAAAIAVASVVVIAADSAAARPALPGAISAAVSVLRHRMMEGSAHAGHLVTTAAVSGHLQVEGSVGRKAVFGPARRVRKQKIAAHARTAS
jgi:hypothetical protein